MRPGSRGRTRNIIALRHVCRLDTNCFNPHLPPATPHLHPVTYLLLPATHQPCSVRQLLPHVRPHLLLITPRPSNARELPAHATGLLLNVSELLPRAGELPCSTRQQLNPANELPSGVRHLLSRARHLPCSARQLLSRVGQLLPHARPLQLSLQQVTSVLLAGHSAARPSSQLSAKPLQFNNLRTLAVRGTGYALQGRVDRLRHPSTW